MEKILPLKNIEEILSGFVELGWILAQKILSFGI